MERQMARVVTALLWIGGFSAALLGGAAAFAQTASAPEDASRQAGRRPRRLRLDLERHVARVLEERGRNGLPRFEDSVEVWAKSPQLMLERYFHGVELECGPTSAGAPTDVEMRAARYHPSPYADFGTLARALAQRVKAPQPSRFFLYRVRRADGLTYAVREGPIPQAWRFNTPGTTFELLEGFPDLKSATAAWRRLERGFATAVPTVDASPPPPWATTVCRPRGFR